jgi:hypothetical protein
MLNFKKYKIIIILSLLIISILFFLYNCIMPYNDKKNNNLDVYNKYLDGISDIPEKEGILSEKQACINGFKYAFERGLINDLKEYFPDQYENIRIGDMFLVNDSINGDYYFVLGEHSDGSIAVMATLDPKNGEVLGCIFIKDGSNLILENKDAVKNITSNYINNVVNINSIKPVFIPTDDSFNRLYHWKWAVITNNEVSTSSGSRNILFVTPFSINSGGLIKSSKISSKNNLPASYKSRISVFKNKFFENELFNKNAVKKDIYEMENINE